MNESWHTQRVDARLGAGAVDFFAAGFLAIDDTMDGTPVELPRTV